jgi:hypothetical protein
MEAKEVVRSGVTIKVARCDEHNLVDIRARLGEQLIFMAAVTPGGWARFEKSIVAAERLLIKAGWLKTPGFERGSLLHLVKSE